MKPRQGSENKQKLSITIAPEIRDRAGQIAHAKGMSLSTLIEQFLRAEIAKDEEQRQVAAARRR